MEKYYLLTNICANIGILYGIYRLDRAIRIMECINRSNYLKELVEMQNVVDGNTEEDMEEDREEKSAELKDKVEDCIQEESSREERADSREERIEERLRRLSDETDDGVSEGVWAKYISFGVK